MGFTIHQVVFFTLQGLSAILSSLLFITFVTGGSQSNGGKKHPLVIAFLLVCLLNAANTFLILVYQAANPEHGPIVESITQEKVVEGVSTVCLVSAVAGSFLFTAIPAFAASFAGEMLHVLRRVKAELEQARPSSSFDGKVPAPFESKWYNNETFVSFALGLFPFVMALVPFSAAVAEVFSKERPPVLIGDFKASVKARLVYILQCSVIVGSCVLCGALTIIAVVTFRAIQREIRKDEVQSPNLSPITKLVALAFLAVVGGTGIALFFLAGKFMPYAWTCDIFWAAFPIAASALFIRKDTLDAWLCRPRSPASVLDSSGDTLKSKASNLSLRGPAKDKNMARLTIITDGPGASRASSILSPGDLSFPVNRRLSRGPYSPLTDHDAPPFAHVQLQGKPSPLRNGRTGRGPGMLAAARRSHTSLGATMKLSLHSPSFTNLPELRPSGSMKRQRSDAAAGPSERRLAEKIDDHSAAAREVEGRAPLGTLAFEDTMRRRQVEDTLRRQRLVESLQLADPAMHSETLAAAPLARPRRVLSSDFSLSIVSSTSSRDDEKTVRRSESLDHGTRELNSMRSASDSPDDARARYGYTESFCSRGTRDSASVYSFQRGESVVLDLNAGGAQHQRRFSEVSECWKEEFH